ncbi:thiopeptide-type bacteriocin biosynthesis protein [Stackebrandtia albiflava]|uniref:Thiopeptide-type bacteriocin biosynthesis protein n=1 Tax=Stackebrandtia albiflava TaxID=406432 RepID=A0A562UQ40_9ACTN|nr:lantibiotic dehydratase [Stackebrandtia albiflava]TWJ07714.1 thiopeptide-type bacteriocin biosynthesis protein [Stackebrandtia albiflava]
MSSIYEYAGPIYARATTLDAGLPMPEFALDDEAEAATKGGDWLVRLWRTPGLPAAFRSASASLVSRIEDVLAGRVAPSCKLLRSVYAYVLRWQRRTTPFGLFAGVASVKVASATKVRFGDDHLVRAGGDWDVIHHSADQLDRDPAALALQMVCANNLATRRNGHLWVPMSANERDIDRGVTSQNQIRITGPVQGALDLSARPVAVSELKDGIQERFPQAEGHRITELIGRLVQCGALISTAKRAMTAPPSPREGCSAVTGKSVHVALDADIALSASVVRELETAAGRLIRLTASPYGTVAWRDYLQRFHERYGAGVMVGVQGLVGNGGLGYPVGFLDAPRRKAQRVVTDRDAAVLDLLQSAMLDRREEIVLTDADVDRIATGTHCDMVFPPRVEALFSVAADSAEEVDAGRFRLHLTGLPRPQSSLTGRFLELLPGLSGEFRDSYLRDDVIVAQLSFPPRRARNGNVTAVPVVLPHVIPLGEHPPSDVETIRLDDLAVVADSTQLHLVQASTGRQVLAYALHALDAAVHTPPMARFLAEVTSAGWAWWGPFDYGVARTLPYLPRVRTGRTILSAARWLMFAKDFPTDITAWATAFTRWRQHWRLPRTVEMISQGTALPLDLDAKADLSLLRSRLASDGKLELTEAVPTSGWSGRACTFVATLRTSTSPPTLATVPVATPSAAPPGGDSGVVCAEIVGHHRGYDEILTSQVPALLQMVAGHAVAWWFTRCHDNARPDSDHFLRFYIRARNAQAHQVTATVSNWATRLHEVDLAAELRLIGYRPAVGRYGPKPIFEPVLTADSAAAIRALASEAPIDAITAVSLIDIAESLAPSAPEGWQWLLNVLPHQSVIVDRVVQAEAFHIADDTSAFPRLRETWNARRNALTEYRREVGRPTDTVLRSLLHDHVIRGIGVDANRERAIQRVARAVAARNLHKARP